MNKPIFIIIASLLSIVVIVLFFVSLVLQVRREEMIAAGPSPYPTPTPSFIPERQPSAKPTVTDVPELTVVETYPLDKATSFPVHDSYLQVTFNQNVDSNDFIFAMRPDVKLKYDFTVPRVVKFIFLEPLQPNTDYLFRINTLKQLPKTFTFTTEAASPSATLQ
jgi:hypothetical protein